MSALACNVCACVCVCVCIFFSLSCTLDFIGGNCTTFISVHSTVSWCWRMSHAFYTLYYNIFYIHSFYEPERIHQFTIRTVTTKHIILHLHFTRNYPIQIPLTLVCQLVTPPFLQLDYSCYKTQLQIYSYVLSTIMGCQ